MKKMGKLAALFLIMGILCNMTLTPVKAAQSTAVNAAARMEELKKYDEGPDPSNGTLLSEIWGTEEDGTPYVERLYEEVSARTAKSTSGKFRKVKNYGATGKVAVTAYFRWDKAAKKVYTSNVNGEYYDRAGISGVKDKETYSGGNGTSKATAKYSIMVNKNLGGWTKYSVSMYCTYTGTSNGVEIK